VQFLPLSPEWNADKTRIDKVQAIDRSRTPVPRNRFVQVGVYGGGWIYGRRLESARILSHNILTLDAW
jgi:hypothetical protein